MNIEKNMLIFTEVFNKKEYGHDELGPGDQFMYIRHVGAIIIGIMVIIIMLIRLMIYGNIYYEW